MPRALRALLVVSLVGTLVPGFVSPIASASHGNLPTCAKERIDGYIPVAQDSPLEATTLHYQVYLPKDEIGGPGPYPAVMDYSGYQPGLVIYDGLHRHFLCEGYAVVGLNLRGTGCSGGKFDYFEPRQAEDGREAIEFLTDPANSPWSNGRLAMVGKSYPGITQLFVAGQPLSAGAEVDAPDGLVAIVPGHVFGDLYRDVPFPGGIMNVTFAAGWSAGRIYEPFQAPIESQLDHQELDQRCTLNMLEHVQNPPQNPFVKAIYNQYDGDLFHERSPWYWAENISMPTFLVESWQDEQVGSRATELIERFNPDLKWRALFGNGDHGEYYGPHVIDDIDEFLRFHLAQEIPAAYQGGIVDGRPETYEEALARYEASDPVTLNWETGAGGGRNPAWTDTYASWPPPNQTTLRLHLHSDGVLGEQSDGDGGRVDYNYLPGLGTQERGGYELTDDLPDELMGSWSNRPPDGTFASFETAPLDQDRLFAGPASLDLLLSSTAPDTDLQVTLTEVRPDGQEVFVQQGWLRASHRKEDPIQTTELRPYHTHLATDVLPLVPGTPADMSIEIFPFAHAFRAGSSIRLYVEAPHTQPDLWGFASLPTPAINTIHTAGSSLALPLLQGDAAPTALPPCSLRNQPCRPAA